MVSSKNNRVFIWKEFTEWKSALEGMFPDILTPELEDKARKNAALVKYYDDPEPFEELSGHSTDSLVSLMDWDKTNEFRRLYSHIRVFHACRPANVSSYYEKGILLLSIDEQIKRFRSIFLRGDYPELTEEILQQSIQKVASINVDPENEICLGLDDKLITEMAGHYLIYGSEYLLALVAQLPVENTKLYLSW